MDSASTMVFMPKRQIRNLTVAHKECATGNLYCSRKHDESVFRWDAIPINFDRSNLRITDALPEPPLDWFQIEMRDPATPAFSTFEKPYFGPSYMIEAYLKHIGQELPLTPCRLSEYHTLFLNDVSWIHRDIWQNTYRLKADRIVVEQAVLECSGWFFLCIRPMFHSLELFSHFRSEWYPVNNHFRGAPNMIRKEVDAISCSLFIAQNFFSDEEDGLLCMNDPKKLNFSRVCDEIFGNV